MIKKLKEYFQLEEFIGSDSSFAEAWVNFKDYIFKSSSSLNFYINFTCVNVKSVTATPKKLWYVYADRFNFRCFTRMDYIYYNVDLHAQVI